MRVPKDASEVEAGFQRWQLWFQGRTGQTPVVEVTGPVEKLAWALVVAAYRRISLDVYSDGTGIFAQRRATPAPSPDTSSEPGQNATL